MTDIENYVKEYATYLRNRNCSINTIQAYNTAIKHMLEETKKTPSTLTFKDMEAYLTNARTTFNYHNKKTRFSALKKYVKYLKINHKNNIYDDYIEQVETTDDDVFKLKEKKRNNFNKETFTREEAMALIEASKDNKRNHAILKFFYYSWQRRGSVVNLSMKDIDFEGVVNPIDKQRYHKVTIEGAKHDDTYDIYIETIVIEAIKDYIKVREEPKEGYVLDNYRRKLYHKDAVFLNGTGQRLRGQAINNFMKNYCIQVGIKKNKIHSHMWRRSGISIAESSNVPLSQIMARSGHNNMESVKPYLNPKTDETNTNISNALALNRNAMTKKKTEIPYDVDKIQDIIQTLEHENKTLKEKLAKDGMVYQ